MTKNTILLNASTCRLVLLKMAFESVYLKAEKKQIDVELSANYQPIWII